MFSIVVYHRDTNKVILALPLSFDRATHIQQLDSLLHNAYDYRVYCDMSPVYYEDDDGDICLKPNSFIVNSNLLK